VPQSWHENPDTKAGHEKPDTKARAQKSARAKGPGGQPHFTQALSSNAAHVPPTLAAQLHVFTTKQGSVRSPPFNSETLTPEAALRERDRDGPLRIGEEDALVLVPGTIQVATDFLRIE
jgi:hypothetical protein